MNPSTYDPDEVIVTFAGNILSGFADGTFIEAERNEDGYTLKVGADGEGVRSRNQNRSGLFTLTLQQSSASNDVLSAIAAADDLGGPGVFPFQIQDNLGRTLVLGANTWIKKRPKVEYGKEASDRQWVFETVHLDPNVGGSL
jgi:hypothetical protein